MKRFLLSALALLFMCSHAHADELSELKDMFQTMQVQMEEMKNRIEQLEQEKQAQSSKDKKEINQLQARVEELEEIKPTTQPTSVISSLNPEVSVIGDLIYTIDKSDGEGDNSFNLREVEIAFSASVDSWARGDLIVAIENEDGSTEVAIEEGYLTLLETPIDNLQAKFGKFRPYFGKTNKMHLHQLPWTNYPLVVQNFLGEEGFSEAGASLSYLIPNPADIFSELTLEVVNNGETVLGGGEEGETIYFAHVKNFVDINDFTSVELGGSLGLGENGNGNSAETKLTGIDLTLNTELFDNLRTTSHTEVLFNDRQEVSGDNIDSWGMFTSLEQQLNERWWTFGRYDFSQMPTASEVDTHAYTAGVTFAQSEYVFWRAMFTHTDNETGKDDNTIWLQMDFSIGPHKPHAYR